MVRVAFSGCCAWLPDMWTFVTFEGAGRNSNPKHFQQTTPHHSLTTHSVYALRKTPVLLHSPSSENLKNLK